MELICYRELIKALVVRDLKARYKRSVLGYLWALLDPLLTMSVFVVLFGIILNLEIKNYPIYLLCGLLPWGFFNACVLQSINCITGNRSLIGKLYCPREIFPLTVVLGNGVNMGFNLIVLFIFVLFYRLPFGVELLKLCGILFFLAVMGKLLKLRYTIFVLMVMTFFYRQDISLQVLMLCFGIVVLFLLALGLAFMFSCLNAFFNDMAYVVPFVMRLWFFACPIFWSLEKGRIPPNYLHYYLILNPVAVVMNVFRYAFMSHALVPREYLLFAFGSSLIVFRLGYLLFKRYEDFMVKRI